MTPSIVLDSDFLSAFLKIDRLSRVRDFYQVDALLVPPAVYREVSLTRHLALLASLSWVRVEIPAASLVEASEEDLQRLGSGEREAIALARQHEGSLLLMNDSQARRAAHRIGVATVDIPAFLLSCKESGFAGQEEIRDLIRALQEQDHYGFRKEILDLLLG